MYFCVTGSPRCWGRFAVGGLGKELEVGFSLATVAGAQVGPAATALPHGDGLSCQFQKFT